MALPHRLLLSVLCVCLYPTNNVTAKSAVKALLKFVGHFGVPPQFISDNGTNTAKE